MWLMLLFIAGLIIGVLINENSMGVWRVLFWLEMRCPKKINRL
jgi:uncharacterized membrane protein YhdT